MKGYQPVIKFVKMGVVICWKIPIVHFTSGRNSSVIYGTYMERVLGRLEYLRLSHQNLGPAHLRFIWPLKNRKIHHHLLIQPQ